MPDQSSTPNDTKNPERKPPGNGPDVTPPSNGKPSGAVADGTVRISDAPGPTEQHVEKEGEAANGEAGGDPAAPATPTVTPPVAGTTGSATTGQGQGVQGQNAQFLVKLAEFKEREEKVIQKYAEAIPEYRDLGRWYLKRHRRISVTLLVCAVMAPVLIASNKELFGVNDTIWITRAAVVLSIVVALLEGLRRLFKYDDRAAAAHHAQRDLVLAREKYRRQRLRHPDLTPDRFRAFEEFWSTYYEDIYNREVSGWTKAFKDDAPAGAPSGGNMPSGAAQTPGTAQPGPKPGP